MELSRKQARAAGLPRAAALIKRALPHAAAAVCGFLLTNVGVGTGLSPFAAAFAAAAPGGLAVSAALGASLGAYVFFDALNSLKYIGAAVLVLLFRDARAREGGAGAVPASGRRVPRRAAQRLRDPADADAAP